MAMPVGSIGHTVLIVEDDPAMAEVVAAYLGRAGYQTVHAEDGDAALEVAQRIPPHLVLLDLMLPCRSGWEVCRELRHRLDVPIIMVTARRAEEDRLRGFAAGADDYVVKPFSPRELVARVGAVLRRARPAAQRLLLVGRLEIDLRRRGAALDGTPLGLRSREFDLLAYLAAHPGEACPRAELLDQVWGYDFEGDERTIDAHVRRLREALGPAAAMLHTVWNVGYSLSAEG